MKHSRLLLVALAAMIGVGGCSLAPEYTVPEVKLPTAFKEAGPWQVAIPADQSLRGEWWRAFGDGKLNELMLRVDSANLDLARAMARYDAARSFVNEARASLFPEVGAIGGVSRNRQSEGRPLRGANQPDTYSGDTLGLGLAYELDFWGRVRNQVTSGEALAAASAADVLMVKLGLQAELASNYFRLRGLDAEAKLLAETVDAYRKQLELIENRYREGIVSGLDVSRAKTQVEEVRAQKFNILAQRALYEHAIAQLVGEPASNFSIEAAISHVTQPEIPAGIPSQILQRRPDIAAAERRVAAANAEIGVARAAFFPSITLGANVGYQNTAAAGLISAPNLFWSIGPQVLLSIFDAGRREALVQRAQAKTGEAVAQYRGTVLQAIREVEDNLVLLRTLKDEQQAEGAAVAAASHSYDLAMNRYREGAVNYLEVVDAEAAKLRTERAALNLTTRGLLATVGLIRAVGGGWDGKAPEVQP